MKVAKKIGNLITILALVLIFRRIWTFDIAWREVLTPIRVLVLFLCLALYTLQVLLNFLPWKKMAGVFTDAEDILKKNRGLMIFLYTKSNILKYIPGNVLQYVGRNELAVLLGLDHVNVATATVGEIILTVLTALIMSGFFIGSLTLNYLASHLSQIMLLGIAALAVLFVLGIVFYKNWREKVLAYLAQYQNVLKRRSAAMNLLFSLAYYGFTFLLNGALFFAVIVLCGDIERTAAAVRILMGSFILSWLAGYITPGSPGGIGIRELILVSSIVGSGIAPEEVVMTASLIYRLINVLGDLLAFCIAFLVFRPPNLQKADEN